MTATARLRLRRRLAALEAVQAAQVADGCETCRAWPQLVVEYDGGVRDRPDCCPDCGRDVPIFMMIELVGVPYGPH